MDTKEKTRAPRPRPEGAADRRPAEAGKKPVKKPAGERPASAQRPAREPGAEQPRHRPEGKAGVQQRSGAPRTEEAQRTAEHRQRKPAEAPRRAPADHRAEAEPRKAPPRKGEHHKAVEERKPTRPPQKKRRQKEPDDTLAGKRRAYGKTKPKKKSSFVRLGEQFRQSAAHAAAKAKAKREGDPTKHHDRAQIPTPAVIYTQPQAFNRNRFLVQLMTVTAMVLALVMGLSVFFKVKNITVSGAEVYSPWAVREASGISEGDNLLSFGNIKAGAKIKANLPYVDKVRLGIKLPDTVNIIIEEEDVVYAIKSSDGIWWLMTSDGRVVEQTSGGSASNYTQILGVTLDNPIPNQKAIATENTPTETGEEGEVIPVAVTGAQRLNAALQILVALEANDIVGEAASINVTQIENIGLWYGTRYQVRLGDATKLEYKIDCMNDVILQMSDYQSGTLDLSFTIWPDKVVYTPFG